MDRLLRASVIVLLLLASGPLVATAQSNRLINTRDWPYELIERLQKRGHLLALNPTDLPYSMGEVWGALQQVDTTALETPEKQWYRQLSDALSPRGPNVDSMRVGGLVTGGGRHSSSDRLNVLEPKGDGRLLLSRFQFNAYLEWRSWIGHGGATTDVFYEADPDGLSTGGGRGGLDLRSEEGYVGYNNEWVKIYLGRFNNHWAMHDRKGGMLTDNPRSFDQVQFQLGNETISFHSILGVLDNMAPDSTFRDAFGKGATRRYVQFHRLDWSPISTLKLSAMEAELYHSPSAGLSLRNLNPLQMLLTESSNTPELNDSNLMVGGSIWYQRGPVTLHVQSMVDDAFFGLNDEPPGEYYPIIYTVNGSVTWAGVTDELDVGGEVDAVSVNSYRTNNRADEWSYLQRGIATNFSDYIRLEGHATWYPTPRFKVEPGLTLYRKGEGDFRQLRTTFDQKSEVESILIGTVERTIRSSVSVRYQLLDINFFDKRRELRFNAWVDADAGINFIKNANHTEGASDRRFIGLFRLFGQITF